MNTARQSRLLAHAMQPVWNDPPSLERALKEAQRAHVRRAAAVRPSEHELFQLDTAELDARDALRRCLRAIGVDPRVIGEML